ncbi:MAG: hypothetical protein K0M78_11350, partial [Brevundimonas sp.]|nr:hypothetical protein [Brevundimonas sp.]
MFYKKLHALIGGAMALALLSSQPALAQDVAQNSAGYDNPSDRVSGNIPGDGARERRDRRNRDRNQERSNAAPAASPEENKAAAQALLTAAGVSCQVSEATLLGVTAEQQATYEATCIEGPGYLAVSSTPPLTFNCLELAGQAETTRLRDPEADVGQQCTLPVNLNPVPVLSAYARAAGVDCTVDQGAAIGKSTAGNLIYEVGCADRDGYWLENAEGAWKATPCWDLALEQETCRYSTAAETMNAWRTVLAGTDAAACDVQQARRVGRDAQGLTVYEVKCGAGGGYFARVGSTFTAQRVNNCIEAATFAGGCTLTAAAPATT